MGSQDTEREGNLCDGELPQPPASPEDQAHLTVITFHMVVSIHGHHTDSCLTTLEEEMGFTHDKQAGV